MTTFKNEAGEEKNFELPYRSRKRVIMRDGEKWKRVPRPKYKSRATKCSQTCGELQGLAEDIRTLASDVREADKGELKSLKETIQGIDINPGELESLRDEIEDWKSGIEGTNLESSYKYEMLEECLDQLDAAVNGIESVDLNDVNWEEEDLNTLAEEIEAKAQELDDAVAEAENAEFPGMYS